LDHTHREKAVGVAVARVNAEGALDAVADHIGGKPTALLSVGWWCGHAASMASRVEAGQEEGEFNNDP
jgi:hypothetical protein